MINDLFTTLATSCNDGQLAASAAALINAILLPVRQDDLRVDGRGCEDYRHMEIETDVVSNTDGSAKVTLVKTKKKKPDLSVPRSFVFLWKPKEASESDPIRLFRLLHIRDS